MSGGSSSANQAGVLRGFGLRGSVGRRLGVAAFLGVQIAVLAWLMEVDYQSNQGEPQGFAAYAILTQLALAAAWFFTSQRRTLFKVTAILWLLSAYTAIIAWHAPNSGSSYAFDRLTELLMYACGFWLVPVIAGMDVLRRRGLRVVALGDTIHLQAPRRTWITLGVLVAAIPYAIVNVVWVSQVIEWVQYDQARPLALVIPQLLCALAAAFVVQGLFAALEHHGAPRSFLLLVAAVAVLWVAIVAMYGARDDLTWVRIRRDSVGAFLGFVPYLHFLWFRALGYRVAYVGADN